MAFSRSVQHGPCCSLTRARRQERAALFRSWGGAASMWLKVRHVSMVSLSSSTQGGSRVWGDEHGAPDDLPGTNLTFSHVYRVRMRLVTGALDSFSSDTTPMSSIRSPAPSRTT